MSSSQVLKTLFYSFQKCYHFLFQRYRLEHYTVSSNWLALSAVVVFTMLSLSRSVALFRGVCTNEAAILQRTSVKQQNNKSS